MCAYNRSGGVGVRVHISFQFQNAHTENLSLVLLSHLYSLFILQAVKEMQTLSELFLKIEKTYKLIMLFIVVT